VAKKLFMRQKTMRRMIYALVPVLVSAIYFFGWRVLAVLAVCQAAGLATEYVTSRRRNQAISEANLVTCWLYALSLPATVPFWIAAVGAVVAMLFGREVFGGFGRNFANPAIVGRAFVYVCFPGPLTAAFVPAFRGAPGGFAHWSLAAMERLPEYLAASGKAVADAVSQASPMWVGKKLGVAAAAHSAPLWDLASGSIGGTFQLDGATRILSAGSMGEGCAILLVLAGTYLLWTRTANWRLMLSPVFGIALATGIFRFALGFDEGPNGVPPIEFTLLAGTTLYVTVFMLTEPVSAPKRPAAMLIYGTLAGFLIVLLRWRGTFVAAASFSVLLANVLSPLIDEGVIAWEKRRAPAADATKEPSGEA
jgi:Na+-transporting NADH:ubiquinone oxidoreductase subunit B